jgi:hypothetical protein
VVLAASRFGRLATDVIQFFKEHPFTVFEVPHLRAEERERRGAVLRRA